MEQPRLWHDSPEEALEADIQAAGGPKAVAKMLWPARDMEAQAKYLRRCLQSERDEKLSPGEITLIVRAAAAKGSRCYASFYARQARAELIAVAPEDKKAQIVERFDELGARMRSLMIEWDEWSGA